MNILALSHGLSLGGAQVSTFEFLDHLKKEANIRIVTCKSPEKGFLEHLERLSIKHRPVSCRTENGIPSMNVDEIEDWVRWAEIVWIVDEVLVPPRIKRVKNTPMVVHLHSYPLLCPWWGLLYGLRDVCYGGCSIGRIVRCKQLFNRELCKLGIIGSVRSGLYQVLDLAKGPLDYFDWRRTVNREVLDSIDAFVAVSNFVKRVHEELLPLEDRPIEVIYNPVTYPLKYLEGLKELETNERNEGDLIVYASGSNPVKGPHLILRALGILLGEGQDIKLLMFGCKGTWVEKYVTKLGLGRNVVCMGRESFDKLYEAMFKAKAVVMPSMWPEPFGRVPVEANRLGVPSVVTKRGGLPETIIQGETGVLVDTSAEEIAKGMLKALNMKRGNEITKKSLSSLDPEKSINKLILMFQRLVYETRRNS